MNCNIYIVGGNDHSTLLQTICPICGRRYTFVVYINLDEFNMRFNSYLNGNLIQNCFPMFDDDTLESIHTGICIDCFHSDHEE